MNTTTGRCDSHDRTSEAVLDRLAGDSESAHQVPLHTVLQTLPHPVQVHGRRVPTDGVGSVSRRIGKRQDDLGATQADSLISAIRAVVGDRECRHLPELVTRTNSGHVRFSSRQTTRRAVQVSSIAQILLSTKPWGNES